MAGPQVSVCIPARNEAATIGPIVACLADLRARGVVDEVVVVDDGSVDDTTAAARGAGATVVANTDAAGKGGALRTAVRVTTGNVLVFLDADVTDFHEGFVTRLIEPLHEPAVALVKPRYRRALHGRPGEGGRVTELVARPLLARFFPELVDVAQPLAGETAVRRHVLEEVTVADGYGIEVGLLIDVCQRWGRAAIAEVDLGERRHRNRPLRELRPHADEVMGAVLDRVVTAAEAAPMTRRALLR